MRRCEIVLSLTATGRTAVAGGGRVWLGTVWRWTGDRRALNVTSLTHTLLTSLPPGLQGSPLSTRLGTLALLQLLDTSLRGLQPGPQLQDDLLHVGDGVPEVGELSAGGAGGVGVGTLEEDPVRSGHQPGLLEVSLEQEVVLVALAQPGGEGGVGEGGVEGGDHPAVDGPAVQPHLQLVPGHRDGQPVPGVVRQPQREGLHPEAQVGPGRGVVEPEDVLTAAGLDLQVPGHHTLTLSLTHHCSPVGLVFAVRKCKDSSAVLALLSY